MAILDNLFFRYKVSYQKYKEKGVEAEIKYLQKQLYRKV